MKEFKYFEPKKLLMSSQKNKFIPDPGSGFFFIPDPGSGSTTLSRSMQNDEDPNQQDCN
jgi:hypothetical protein